MLTLLRHSWKSSIRSILWGRELAANIFIGIMLAMVALNLLGLGLFIGPLLERTHPGEDPVPIINQYLLFYFFADIILRLLLQKIPSLEVLSYLLLPVPRAHVVRYMLLRMLLSVFNIIPLLAIVPIGLTVMMAASGPLSMTSWLAAFLCMMVLSNVLVFLIEKMGVHKMRAVMGLLILVVAMIFLDKASIIDIPSLSAAWFGAFLDFPFLGIGIVLAMVISFEASVALLTRLLNLESLLESGTAARVDTGLFRDLDSKGTLGAYLSLELKLLLRNSRARSSFSIVLVVILMVPALYLTSPSFNFDFYPVPDHPPTDEIFQHAGIPEERLVRFVVQTDNVPEDAWVYLTGNHNTLGPWRPTRVPLVKHGDGTWSRSVPFMAGTSLRYIFTLGSWKTEMYSGPELEPDTREMTVRTDTTIIVRDPQWKTPVLDGFESTFVLYMQFILIGMFMLVYGQFVFVWESNYFDLLLTRPIRMRSYLAAKFILLYAFGLIGVIISLPTIFISMEFLPFNIAVGLYTLGVNSYVIVLWSTLSKKRLDLTASIFSTQGKGGTNFMTIIPLLIGPVVVSLLFNVFVWPGNGLAFLGALGILGMVLHVSWVRLIGSVFHRKKYVMRAGFRAS